MDAARDHQPLVGAGAQFLHVGGNPDGPQVGGVSYTDAGIITTLLERRERESNRRKRTETSLTEVLTERAVLRPYVSTNTVRSIYRKFKASSREVALERARDKAII